MESHAHSIGDNAPELLRFAADDGLLLAGTQAHGEGAQPVLLAHGFGQTRQSWSATQVRLADAGHPSLAFDTRGHGQSARNPASSRYDAGQFIGDQAVAVRQLGGFPVLVGASMGGLIGLLAQAQRKLFSALVLVDITPRWEAAGMQRIHAFMTAFPAGFDSFAHASQAIADYLPHRREHKTPEQLSHLLRPGPGGRLHWHWDPRLLEEFANGNHELQDTISHAAREVDVPVLLISGGRSDLVSDETVAHFIELVPHATHVRLPDATHMLAGDDNDAFTSALLYFLRAHFPHAVPLASPATATPASLSPGVPR